MGGKAVTDLLFKQCTMVFIVVLKLSDYADNILHGRQEALSTIIPKLNITTNYQQRL